MTDDNRTKDSKICRNFLETYSETDFELEYHLKGKLSFVQLSTLGL